jgi:hypothetical protein
VCPGRGGGEEGKEEGRRGKEEKLGEKGVKGGEVVGERGGVMFEWELGSGKVQWKEVGEKDDEWLLLLWVGEWLLLWVNGDEDKGVGVGVAECAAEGAGRRFEDEDEEDEAEW